MDSYCIEELYFWKNNLNSIKVRDSFLFNKPQRFAYSDASATGCGSVITIGLCVSQALGAFRVFYEFYLRELAAIVFALRLLRQFWKVHLSSGSRIAKRRIEL